MTRLGTTFGVGAAVVAALVGCNAILANDPTTDRPELTDQEQRVLMLYASGLKMAAVARTLHISPYTAKEYIDRVRTKYANAGRPASTKLDLHREAVRDGYVEP